MKASQHSYKTNRVGIKAIKVSLQLSACCGGHVTYPEGLLILLYFELVNDDQGVHTLEKF